LPLALRPPAGQAFEVIVNLDGQLTHTWPTTFRFEQAVPASVWSINHGLNAQPAVDTLSLADEQILGDVAYVDADNLTITFSTPMAGVAILRR
jgi:hypothetical protein